jgi:putative acetyltransferase
MGTGGCKEKVTMNELIITLRHANIDDLPEMQALYVETIKSTCKKEYNQEQIFVWTSSVENKARWKEALTHQYFLIAEVENNIVGFGSLENGDYLDFMYVHKDYLRQGIADKLYQALENESQRLECTIMTSDVSKTARPFFEQKGFKVLKENINIIRGVEIVNYRMIKEK